jgi:tripartite-type tricarboxylate transporter receptor subunit TctC
MTYIKYLMMSLLLAATLSAHAREINNVWLPFTGGNFESLCRKIWDLYDAKYQTTTMIHVRPGASGELASKDMLDSPLRNKSICAGVTMIVYNQYLFPGTKTFGDDLSMVIRAVTLPKVVYAPNSTPPMATLNQYVSYLKSLQRPINVGYFHGADRLVIQYLAKTYNLAINPVAHKSGPQMYASLADASLDLALDGGTAVRVAQEGRFRVMGFVGRDSITPLRGYVNFGLQDRELAEIDGWFGIAVARDTDAAGQQQLQERLLTIIRDDTFRSLADASITSADGLTGAALTSVIRRNRQTAQRFWQ